MKISILAPADKFDRFIVKSEKFLLMVFFIILLSSSLTEIIMRFFNQQITILSPLIKISTFFLCFLGGSLAVATSKSIRLDIATKVSFIKNHSLIFKVTFFICMTLSVYLFLISINYLKMEISFNEVFHTPIKVWHIELIFPLFFFNTSFHFFNLFLKEKW